MTEAFPWDTAPRYLLRDRDASYGPAFRDRVQVTGIKEVITAPRSPWQNPYVERFIGSIRRECLDHIIIFNERHLRSVLSRYFQYHHRTRTHLLLDKIVRSLAAYNQPLQARFSCSQRWAICIAPHDRRWSANRRARIGVTTRSIVQLRPKLTLGNIGGSPTRATRDAETGLAG